MTKMQFFVYVFWIWYLNMQDSKLAKPHSTSHTLPVSIKLFFSNKNIQKRRVRFNHRFFRFQFILSKKCLEIGFAPLRCLCRSFGGLGTAEAAQTASATLGAGSTVRCSNSRGQAKTAPWASMRSWKSFKMMNPNMSHLPLWSDNFWDNPPPLLACLVNGGLGCGCLGCTYVQGWDWEFSLDGFLLLRLNTPLCPHQKYIQ